MGNTGVIKSLNVNGNINALTVNVDDWFQVANLRTIISFENWDNYEGRIQLTISKILALLSNEKVKATFFVLGWIAKKNPEIIKKIHDEGHEIAVYGYSNKPISELTPEQFKQELTVSMEIIQKCSGQTILGYRAPHFSITPETIWAWQILAQFGFKYDSSIFPVKHDRYGFLSAPRFPFIINLKEYGKLIEFPLSTIPFLRSNIPVAGGAYLRLYPYWFIRTAIKKLNAQGIPAIIYFHPWELDVHQPRVKINFTSRFRHYGNLLMTEHKLKKLVNDFKFAPVREVLGLDY